MKGGTPLTLICAGGGGVGKTTASAALALALARTGKKTLVVTVDPARRLAQAMGVDIDSEVHPARVEPGLVAEHLFALMPEPRHSTRMFVELLFCDEPEALERLLRNPIYATFTDSLVGIHDLVSLMLVAQAAEDGDYDCLVVDTAPSRYALDFVSYPERLAVFFEGRAVGWLSRLAQRAHEQGDVPPAEESLLWAWSKRRVERLIGRLIEPRMLSEIAAMAGDLLLVQSRFAAFARASERLLLGERARYLLVAAPTGAAAADAHYLIRKLGQLRQRPAALIFNRSDPAIPRWLEELLADGSHPPGLTTALGRIRKERSARQLAGDRMVADFAERYGRTPALRLPTIEARDPTQIMRGLADELAAHLPLLLQT